VPSAWDDAQDGTLDGNPAAAYLNDVALRTPVVLDVGGHGEARLLVAFGPTARAARAAYGAARRLSASTVTSEDQARWRQRAEALLVPDRLPTTLPAEDRARIVRASRRALLHMYNGTDRGTGAIVASIARQAPYGLDWPRDGAFFDLALDVAGDWQAVSRRLAWALPLARTEPLGRGDIDLVLDPAPPVDPRSGLRAYPEAAWEMNYYADGTLGGFFRFEIDNTAWMVWSAAVHAAWAPEDVRDALARAYWEPVRRSAELLAAWRDPQTGLQAPAQEDDNAAYTQTLHGGTAVFAALEAAARLARQTGHPTEASRWELRAGELRDVLVARFYDLVGGRFVNDVTGAAASNPGSSALGATAWLVHPARLLPYNDPRVGAQVRRDLEQVLAQLRGDPGTEGGAYLTKTTLAAAVYLARGGDPSVRPLLEESVARLARDVIDPDTQVLGEVFVTVRDARGAVLRRENRVSVPHLWEGALFYLSAMALSHPERFAPELSVFPANETPAPGTVGFRPPPDGGRPDGALVDVGMDAGLLTPPRASGCGCRAPAGGGATGLGLALAALATGAARRRRGAGTPPGR
jgi:MYXO-CTERM domain-containing protein